MKKLTVVAMALMLFIGAANAQGGGQRMTAAERSKAAMEKLAPLNLDADAKTKTETVMTEFYTSQQKAMEEMRASGTMDRDAMMAKRKELSEARDAKLKAIFTEEQLKKWTSEIEPSLRPQRGNNYLLRQRGDEGNQ